MGKNPPKKEGEKKEDSDSEDDGDFEVEEGESGSGSSSSEESGSSSGDEEGSGEEESSSDEAEEKPKGRDPLANYHDTITSSGFTIHSASVRPLPAAHYRHHNQHAQPSLSLSFPLLKSSSDPRARHTQALACARLSLPGTPRSLRPPVGAPCAHARFPTPPTLQLHPPSVPHRVKSKYPISCRWDPTRPTRTGF